MQIPSLCSPLVRVTLALSLALLAVDVLWLAMAAPFGVAGADMRTIATTLISLGVVVVVCAVIGRRMAGDTSRIGGGLLYGARATLMLAASGGFVIFVTTTMAIFNYLAMTTALPLQDALFAGADRAIGFDWLAFLAWVDARPLLAEGLVLAYASSLPQMAAVIVLFSLLLRGDRLLEFAALYTITGVVVAGVAMLMPALGAYAWHAPDPALFTHMSDLGYVHLPTLKALRAGTFEVLAAGDLVGMVSFPSFHTVLAILVPYVFRGYRWLFYPLCALNAVVIVSTLPEGGHYLVDLLGGAAIALGAIALVRAMQRPNALRPTNAETPVFS